MEGLGFGFGWSPCVRLKLGRWVKRHPVLRRFISAEAPSQTGKHRGSGVERIVRASGRPMKNGRQADLQEADCAHGTIRENGHSAGVIQSRQDEQSLPT